MHALILRRVALIETGAGGPVLIGPEVGPDVVRLQGFLARNAYPHQLLDPARNFLRSKVRRRCLIGGRAQTSGCRLCGKGSDRLLCLVPNRFSFLSAVRFLVHGRPSATLCFVVQDTAAFAAFFDVGGQRSRRAAPAAGPQNRCKDKTARRSSDSRQGWKELNPSTQALGRMRRIQMRRCFLCALWRQFFTGDGLPATPLGPSRSCWISFSVFAREAII